MAPDTSGTPGCAWVRRYSAGRRVREDRYTTTTRVTRPSRVIKIDAAAVRQACEDDPHLAVGLMTEVARAAMERLGATRVQLAVPE